ncbi:MAG TPA: threonine/serine dehydratase [Actinocrinis sp.]|uniref:threonine ammonia-lyase n=1 Tax=Actinocrinis sp. TaxID=1920516 RepID=UPI002DDCAA12|nr:threonine/serine dehydratase [Actinocrinis sp.]HEV3173688.1 threonine/serine dehydratase [Actinocrinis sp.]
MTDRTTELVGYPDVAAAAGRIAGIAVRTPLLPCPWADPDRPLWIKAECLQPTGAFKIRGAVNALACLSPEQRERGVVAVSSGNHAQAVAYAAARFGIPALIAIPEGSAPNKVAATEALGAEVVRVPAAEREQAARSLAAERGRTLVHPFDDPRVIAGQGTVGMEIAAQAAEQGVTVDTVLVPVGGGGLISGIAAALDELIPEATVLGVEPEFAADAQQSLRTGTRTAWPVEDTWRTIADALRASSVGELTWRHIQALVDDILAVPEDAIRFAVRVLAFQSHLVVEPGGATAVAGYLAHRAELPPGRTYVAVVSGGNVDADIYLDLLD